MNNVAFVTFFDHKPQTLTHHQALMLDQVMKGLITGTPKQQAFAKRVRKIYFAKQHDDTGQKREAIPVPAWWHK